MVKLTKGQLPIAIVGQIPTEKEAIMVKIYGSNGLAEVSLADAQATVSNSSDNYKLVSTGAVITAGQLRDGDEIVRVVKAVAA